MKTTLYAAVVMAGIFSAPSISATPALAPSSSTEKVLLQVTTIVLDEDRSKKIQDTESLIKLVAEMDDMDVKAVDQRAIMLLAQVLKDPDCGVRVWVAVAIARFGYRAQPALPALEAAYRQTQDEPISKDLPLLQPVSAHNEIGNAIEMIKRDLEGQEGLKSKE